MSDLNTFRVVDSLNVFHDVNAFGYDVIDGYVIFFNRLPEEHSACFYKPVSVIKLIPIS